LKLVNECDRSYIGANSSIDNELTHFAFNNAPGDGDPSMPFDLKEANQLSNFILVFKG